MTIKAQTDSFDAVQLQKDLNWLFRQHNVSVGTGLTKDGVTILSQDFRVDARNIGIVKIQKENI